MREIGMLLHVPNYAEECALKMLRQIKQLKSVLTTSHLIINEWWQLDFVDCKERTAVYTTDIRNGEYWSDGWKSFKGK